VKLLSVIIEASASCGGLLNGFELYLRYPFELESGNFEPMCLIGPNGSGKSQFLQTLAEIFQSAWHACSPLEERSELNSGLAFTAEYIVSIGGRVEPTHVRISRHKAGQSVLIESLVDGEWQKHEASDPRTSDLLPSRIIGYTSGENETLSLPFFTSRAGYADEVTTRALPSRRSKAEMPASDSTGPLEPRLMLIDYSTHLEVLVANLLLGTEAQREALLSIPQLKSLRACSH
jgi:energy-coupling factor transporter ATP-binding protein EcfA2